MFNFGGGLLAGQYDCKKERAPPSRPIPVTFPSLAPPEGSLSAPTPAWTNGRPAEVAAHVSGLKKPSDVSWETVELLNVSFEHSCDFETLLPAETQSFLPSPSWLDAPEQSHPPASTSEPSIKLLSNGRRVPDRNEFYVRARELFTRNENAFVSLTRKASPDQHIPRLAHFRKFFEGLDNLAYYWDSSLDEYLPPKPEPASSNDADNRTEQAIPASPSALLRGAEPGPELAFGSDIGLLELAEPRKKAKTEGPSNGDGAPAISSSQALPARTVPPEVPKTTSIPSVAENPVDLSKGSYRGYRIGNGAEMPDQYRTDCVRGFLEPITWAFGVTLVQHRRPPVLCLQNVKFPVRMNTVAWRGPTDRIKARQGWLEGPVLGIQCRPETSFGSTGDFQSDSIIDAVRELGGMLLLAQERLREGRTETKAGEGKWWTTAPRWGGGPGGEVGEATGASDAPSQEITAPKPDEKPSHSRLRMGSLRDRRRPSPAEIWKTLRPSNPLWDPKTVYESIGKDTSSDWDEIFMVSSLNHHISVLKLRVHKLYMQYLTDGISPAETPADGNWCSPTLQRTRWFDLFSIEDRTEAMRGIWGITNYLMRPREPEQEKAEDKEDVAMSGT